MGKLNRSEIFSATVAISAALTWVIYFIMKYFDENSRITPIMLVITGSVVGAGIGLTFEIIGKGDTFSRLINGIGGNMIYGAIAGTFIAYKTNDPVTSAIAGAITGALASLFYGKHIRNFRFDNQILYDIIFSSMLGATFIVISAIVDLDFYFILYFIIPGIISGAIFGAFFGIIHRVIGCKGAIGGAIIGSLVAGEFSKSINGTILGLILGACTGGFLVRSRFGGLVIGALFGGCIFVLMGKIFGVL